jgi:hypothetical protein
LAHLDIIAASAAGPVQPGLISARGTGLLG